MASPVLMPRSRVHALAQITICIILFCLRPDLIPQWYFFPLTLLLVAVIALIMTLARGGRPPRAAPAELQPPKPVTAVDASTTGQKAASSATRAVGGTGGTLPSRVRLMPRRLVDAARRLVKRSTDSVRRLWCTERGKIRVVRGWTTRARPDRRAPRLQLGVLAERMPQLVWTWIMRCLRLLLAEVVYILLHDFRTDVPCRRRLFSVRRELGNGIEMATSVVRSTVRQFIWLCLCTMHFLSFTLGLTIVFPCLCAYGLVISCIHLILSQGTRDLTRSAASYFM